MTNPQSSDERDRTASSFWDWAVDVYSRPEVAGAALALQDRAGLNVNLALWCCWCATQYSALDDLTFRHAIEAIEKWNANVTGPLRSARRALKAMDASAAFYDSVKANELEAEKIEIQRLEAVATKLLTPTGTGDPEARARRNLAAYANIMGASRNEDFSTALLHRLIDHIFARRDDSRTS